MFTKHRGSVLVVCTSAHPTDGQFTLAHGVEDRDGDLPTVVEETVAMDRNLTAVRERFPYLHAGMGRRPGQPPQIILSDANLDEHVVLQRDEQGRWRPEDGPDAWRRIAPAAGAWADAEPFLSQIDDNQ